MKYEEAQPRAVAIKDAVLQRRMPPWGAVKGFGEFRDDQGLTQEEIELITDWVEGDTPRGSNPNTLPKAPKFPKVSTFKVPKNAIMVKGTTRLEQGVVLSGLIPQQIPPGTSAQVVVVTPDGDVRPLVWFYEYKDAYRHPFLFRTSLHLPAGTEIRGLPEDASLLLLPNKNKK